MLLLACSCVKMEKAPARMHGASFSDFGRASPSVFFEIRTCAGLRVACFTLLARRCCELHDRSGVLANSTGGLGPEISLAQLRLPSGSRLTGLPAKGSPFPNRVCVRLPNWCPFAKRTHLLPTSTPHTRPRHPISAQTMRLALHQMYVRLTFGLPPAHCADPHTAHQKCACSYYPNQV